jgi:hypothetical protein
MAKARKIRCDCGAYLEEQIAQFDDFETEALVCPNCHFRTLTQEQAEKYVQLKRLHRIMDSEKKVIKIGNSMGITLPDSLKEFGVKVGGKVRIEALSDCSFKVVLSQ